MKKLFLLTLAFCSFQFVSAQEKLPKSMVFTGLSFAGTKDMTALSMPVAISHSIAGNTQFRYIAGIRQSLAYGAAEFIFNDQEAWIDDLSNYSINIMGGFEYLSNRKFSAGLTIDLIGASVGTRSYKTVDTDPVYKVNPEGLNVFMGGDNSKGTLNSELYLGYRVSEQLTAKIGVTRYHLGLLYSNTKTPSTSAGTFLTMPFVHLQYSLWEQ